MDVVVIGSGVAGGAAARRLARHGLRPIVLEAADVVGGRTRTDADSGDGVAVDVGAIFVMGSYDRTLAVLRESGHAADMRRWIARTAVLDDEGAKHEVRLDQPWSLLRLPHLSWSDRVRAARVLAPLALGRDRSPFDIDELAALDDGTTLAEWASSTMGERVFEYVVRPLMDPLTGADPAVISSAFTRALLTQPTRTQLTVPPGGLGAITRWLLEGVEVRTATRAGAVELDGDGVAVTTDAGMVRAGGAVVATDLPRVRPLIEGVADTAVLDGLSGVTDIPAYHVLFGYHRDPWPGATHDLVVRAGPGMHHDFGVLLNSRRNVGSSPRGGQTVSVWVDRHQTAGLDEAGVVKHAAEAVAQTFGHAEPDFHRVVDFDSALIAPTPGHYRRMRAVRDVMPERVRLAGDFLAHSGIEGALRAGEQAADDLVHVARGSA